MVAAVEVGLDDFLDDEPEETVLLTETAQLLRKEAVKAIE